MPSRISGEQPRRFILLTTNSDNLLFIQDKAGNKFLVDSGAAISICKPHVVRDHNKLRPENIVIHGISNHDIFITKSYTYLPNPNVKIPHKIYVHSLDLKYDGILGLDFLKQYNCKIDIPNRILQTSFRDIPLLSENTAEIVPENNHDNSCEYRDKSADSSMHVQPKQNMSHNSFEKNETVNCENSQSSHVDNSTSKLPNNNRNNSYNYSTSNTGSNNDRNEIKNCSADISATLKSNLHGKLPANGTTKFQSSCHNSQDPPVESLAKLPSHSLSNSRNSDTVSSVSQLQIHQDISRNSLCNKFLKNSEDCLGKPDSFKENIIKVPARTISYVRLKCTPCNFEVAICPRIDLSKTVRIPSALVRIDHDSFITSVANISTSDAEIQLPLVDLEKFEESNVFSVDNSPNKCIDQSRFDNVLKNLRLEHLNQEESKLIQDLCISYSDIFFLEGDKLSFTSAIKHEINIGDNKPIFTKSYRYPQIHKQEVKSQIQTMLDQGIIKPSVSPWSSPVWVVPKKLDASGVQKWRVVIDYRKLNELTIDDKYPLPIITDILDQLGKCSYFSTLDLASGFHQVEVSPKDTPKTAFSVENGHYEFLRMPFGLKNSPSTFQRVVDNVMTGLQGEQCLVYMDDIIIYSSTLEEHLERLRNVFDRLRQSNFKIQPDKCEFLRKEVAYLGHLITENGVRPNPAKIDAIQRFPQPKNPKEIKQFLGLTGYYRRFVMDYSKIIKPLTNLLKKDVPFNFNESCVKAFETCKKFLTEAPILQYPKFDEEFVLTTDASAFAIGSVLSQGPVGKDLPIAYASRTLNPAETRYSVIERELLAIVWSVKHFRPYLFGRRFKLVTDHKPLQWLFSVKDPGSRLSRWRLQLEEYDYEIIYKPGKKNGNADALSRITINTITVEDEIKTLTTPQKWQSYIENILINYEQISHSNHSIFHKNHHNVIFAMPNNPKSSEDVRIWNKIQQELNDTDLIFTDNLEIRHSMSNKNRKFYLVQREPRDFNPCYFRAFLTIANSLPEDTTYYLPAIKSIALPKILSKIFRDKNMKFVICHDTIISDPPKDERKSIIRMIHLDPQNFHKGINETLRKLQQKYFWQSMRSDVENFIKSCETCNKSKINRKNLDFPLVLTETPNRPFERINIDTFDFNRHSFLSIIDDFSKFVQVYHIEDKTGSTIKRKLAIYFQHFPIPKRIHSDLGSEFNNNIIKDFCKLYGIKLTFSASDHPQSNASVERFHATLADSLRCFANDHPNESLIDAIPLIVNSYNNSRNTSTQYTPQEIIFGHLDVSRNLLRVSDEHSISSQEIKEMKSWCDYFYPKIRNNIDNSKQKSKERFDNHVRNEIPQYEVGQLVYLKNIPKKKHSPRYTGPHKILRLVGERNVELKLNSRKYIVNIDKIKPYISNDDFSASDDEPLSNLINSDNNSVVAGPSSGH